MFLSHDFEFFEFLTRGKPIVDHIVGRARLTGPYEELLTANAVDGLPCGLHMVIGESGTGKSRLVRAIGQVIRYVEEPKSPVGPDISTRHLYRQLLCGLLLMMAGRARSEGGAAGLTAFLREAEPWLIKSGFAPAPKDGEKGKTLTMPQLREAMKAVTAYTPFTPAGRLDLAKGEDTLVLAVDSLSSLAHRGGGAAAAGGYPRELSSQLMALNELGRWLRILVFGIFNPFSGRPSDLEFIGTVADGSSNGLTILSEPVMGEDGTGETVEVKAKVTIRDAYRGPYALASEGIIIKRQPMANQE